MLDLKRVAPFAASPDAKALDVLRLTKLATTIALNVLGHQAILTNSYLIFWRAIHQNEIS